MNSLCLTLNAILIALSLHDIQCLKVSFTGTQVSKKPVDIDLKCTFQLKKKEHFKKMCFYKDNYLFYQVEEKTRNEPRFYHVEGVSQVINRAPGHITIHNANHSTSGSYECKVYYTKHHLLHKGAKHLNIKFKPSANQGNVTGGAVNLTMVPMSFHWGNMINVTCQGPQIDPQHVFHEMSLVKGDDKVIARIDEFGRNSSYTTHGIWKVVWNNMGGIDRPLMNVTIMDANSFTADKYQCLLLTKNKASLQTEKTVSNTTNLMYDNGFG